MHMAVSEKMSHQYIYIYVVEAAKRDLHVAHIIKNFQEGASKLTCAIKCTRN